MNYLAWKRRTNTINKEKTLSVGSTVIDFHGHKGIVVRIVKGNDSEEQGTVYVWQLNRTGYGADNCEHYPEFEWQDSLRIIKDIAG